MDAVCEPNTGMVLVESDAIQRVTTGAYGQSIDALEVKMLAEGVVVDLPLNHRFTPGLYIRTIFMPAGTLLTSKIHKTEHPYVVSLGRAMVLTDTEGWQEIKAPYHGVTMPGTRRVLYIVEDCVWTTYHPTGEMGVNLDGLDETERLACIEAAIIEKHDEHRIDMETFPPLPGGIGGVA